jgi:hypothetical protein
MMEAISSSETSVLSRATRRNISKHAILQRISWLPAVLFKIHVIIIIIIIIIALQPFVGPWSYLSLLFLYTVGETPWTEYQPVVWPLSTLKTTQR